MHLGRGEGDDGADSSTVGSPAAERLGRGVPVRAGGRPSRSSRSRSRLVDRPLPRSRWAVRDRMAQRRARGRCGRHASGSSAPHTRASRRSRSTPAQTASGVAPETAAATVSEDTGSSSAVSSSRIWRSKRRQSGQGCKHRRTGRGSGRQDGQIRRYRNDQVGPGLEQHGEVRVRCGTEPVGKTARPTLCGSFGGGPSRTSDPR